MNGVKNDRKEIDIAGKTNAFYTDQKGGFLTMVSVSKVNFKANETNLLQQHYAAKNSPGSASTSLKSETPPILSNPPNAPKTANTLNYVNAGIALAALGVGIVVATKHGQLSKLLTVKNAEESAEKLTSKKVQELIDEKIKTLITKDELKEQIDGVKKEVKDLGKYQDGFIKDLTTKVNNIGNQSAQIIQTSIEHNLNHIDNLKLLQNLNNEGKQIKAPDSLIEKLKNTARSMIYNGVNRPKAKVLDDKSTIWSITAESLPEKEGGLGEVPTQIAKNLKEELGINNYVVLPLYQIKGKSKIVENNDKFHYFYDLQKDSPYSLDSEKLDKLVKFEIQTFRNGKSEIQKVEVFIGKDDKNKVTKIYIKNNDYFNTTGLYRHTQTVQEPERFAFFSKAVYEFLKLKADENSHASYEIFNQKAFEDVKVPDAMILNDWHAAPLAGLMKLQAPLESAFGELNKKTAEIFSSMNLVNIVHNADYKGASHTQASEMLNTLFGKYASDIYEYARTGFGNHEIERVLTAGNGNPANLANIGACLSNTVVPVSKTYAEELAQQSRRSKELQHVFEERLNQGTMKGIVNGWDRSVNEVSFAKLPGFNKSINEDKITIIRDKVTSIDLPNEESKSVRAILNSSKDFSEKINDLKNMNIDSLNKLFEELDSKGLTAMRSYKAYTAENSIEEIIEARKHNKAMTFDYIKSMIEYNKTNEKKLFNIMEVENTDISDIEPEELDDIPFYSMGTRFVHQKGIDIIADGIRKLYKDWDVKYPGRKKPIFLLGGADDQGGKYRDIVVNLKKELGKDGSHIVHMDGFAPNNIFQSGCDFSVYPSWFEPNGSQEESLAKGTPVIGTKVGGLIDTIKNKVTGYLTKRTRPEIDEAVKRGEGYGNELVLISDDLETTFRDSLTDFYGKTNYQEMVRKAIDEDFSWLIKDAEGYIVDSALVKYLKVLNFDLSKLTKAKFRETATN